MQGKLRNWSGHKNLNIGPIVLLLLPILTFILLLLFSNKEGGMWAENSENHGRNFPWLCKFPGSSALCKRIANQGVACESPLAIKNNIEGPLALFFAQKKVK
jgi:hypothetical protein